MRTVLTTLAAAFAAASTAAETNVATLNATALDDYIQQPDDAFTWKVVNRRSARTGYELTLELTSQAWRAEGEVDRTLWKHWLVLTVPSGADERTAMLFISGGRNGDPAPASASGLTRAVALATRSVVAELRMVPNQPLEILGDGRDRYEDDLLARSWVEYLKSGDPNWIAQLPMTKSAVRAMDTVQQALAAESDPIAIERFVVSGASKRGWTTWLTAAVDDRVAAIAPIVIDMLNIKESMRHHRAVYGFWAEALGDYEGQGIADRLNDPAVDPLLEIVDPYAYRDRLTLPKCLINASGDEFFLPDSSRYYFDGLVGEKHLAYFPNAGHSLEGSNALDTLIAFHHCVVNDVDRPTVTWAPGADRKWTVTCSDTPQLARLYSGSNPSARDFRRSNVGDIFTGRPVEPNAGGDYVIELAAPEAGWTAAFAQFTFDVGAAKPLRLTTPVWVTPDTEPYAGAE